MSADLVVSPSPTPPSDAFTILRSHGFNPTALGLDAAVQGLADRLARTERALAETERVTYCLRCAGMMTSGLWERCEWIEAKGI
jgi:hypothetical protein